MGILILEFRFCCNYWINYTSNFPPKNRPYWRFCWTCHPKPWRRMIFFFKSRKSLVMTYCPGKSQYRGRWTVLLLSSERPPSAPHFVRSFGRVTVQQAYKPVKDRCPSVAFCKAKSEGGDQVVPIRSNYQKISAFKERLMFLNPPDLTFRLTYYS